LKKDLDDFENELKTASIVGAKEDLIHVSPEDHGYDLRLSELAYIGEKQQKD